MERKRLIAAITGGATAIAVGVALTVAPAPAQADPPIGVGLLDPTCLVTAVVLGTTICLVHISTTSTVTSMPTTGPPITSTVTNTSNPQSATSTP